MPTATKYNAYAIRRTVRPAFETEDGIRSYVSKSFTSAGSEDRYHPTVDLTNGRIVCDCKDFEYRKARFEPTVNSPASQICKHCLRVANNLKAHGEAV
jgi:hypothetical protein